MSHGCWQNKDGSLHTPDVGVTLMDVLALNEEKDKAGKIIVQEGDKMLANTTRWAADNEVGDTLRSIFAHLNMSEHIVQGKWWSAYLDAPTHLVTEQRLPTDHMREVDVNRVWDEAARIAHVGRFAFADYSV